MFDFDTTETEGTSAPEQVDESNAQGQETTQAPVSDILDIDSVEKFKFQGREWTPKELQSAYMMQQDYTRKTQGIAEERKYWDNLHFDLERVKKDPNLIGQFMQIYPQKFHRFLDAAGAALDNPGAKQSNGQGVDPSFIRRFEQLESDIRRFEQLESEFRNRNVAAIEAELDNKFAALQKKYPFADEEAILARAEALLNKGAELDDKTWDSLWKANNERMEQIYKNHYSKQVASQKNANKKAADIAPGGGTPGQKPRNPRTIKEASRFALDEMESS